MKFLILFFYNRIILAACVVAIKYQEDLCNENTFYSKVGGINLEELNRLEYELLSLCDFEMTVDMQTYTKYFNFLAESELEIDEEDDNE